MAGVGGFALMALPVNTVAPATDTNSPTVGNPITCDSGTWLNSPTSFTYFWRRAGNNPVGNPAAEHLQTYIPHISDFPIPLFCIVTATNAAGSTDANSNTTNPVGL